MKIKNLSKKKAGAISAIYLAIEAISLFLIIKILGGNEKREIASIWVFFTSMIPLAQLAVSGYTTIITRELAKANDTDNVNCNAKNNIKKEADRLFKKSIIFLFLCLIWVVIYLYIKNESKFIIAFTLYFCGIIARAYILYLSAHFLGLKKYGVDKIIMLNCTAAGILLVYFSSKLFHELPIIVCAYVFPYIIGAVVSKIIFRKMIKKESYSNSSSSVFLNKEIFKMHLINFAGFLTLNTDVLIAKQNFDSHSFVEYGLLSKATMGIVAFSGIVITLQFPSYSALFSNGNILAMKEKIIKASILVTIFSLITGIVFFLMHGELVLTILNRQPVVDSSVVVVLLIFIIAVVNTMNVGMAIIATGDSRLVSIALPIAIIGFIASAFGSSLYGIFGMVSAMTFFGIISFLFHVKLLNEIIRK